jgi:hypothetical protein
MFTKDPPHVNQRSVAGFGTICPDLGIGEPPRRRSRSDQAAWHADHNPRRDGVSPRLGCDCAEGVNQAV